MNNSYTFTNINIVPNRTKRSIFEHHHEICTGQLRQCDGSPYGSKINRNTNNDRLDSFWMPKREKSLDAYWRNFTRCGQCVNWHYGRCGLGYSVSPHSKPCKQGTRRP